MIVLNDETEEFAAVAAAFDQVSFDHALHLSASTSNSARGNKQHNFGVAVHHFPADGCSVSHVAKPGYLKDTELHSELFDAMSSLDEALPPHFLYPH